MLHLSRGVYFVPILCICPTEWEVSFWISRERNMGGRGIYYRLLSLHRPPFWLSSIPPLSHKFILSPSHSVRKRWIAAVSQRVGAQAVARFFVIIIRIKTGKYVNVAAISHLEFFCRKCLFLIKTAKAAPNAPYRKCKSKQNVTWRIYAPQTWFNELNPIWSYWKKQGKMCKYRQLQQKQDILNS